MDDEMLNEVLGELTGQPEVEQDTEVETGEAVETETTGETQERTDAVEEVETEATPATDEGKTVPLKALQEERRKRQEYEAKIAELEMAKTPHKQEATQSQSLEEWYEADPQAATYAINQEIARLQVDDPYNPQTLAQIEYLRDKKIELAKTVDTRVQTRNMELYNDAKKLVPDYETKKEQLFDFATTSLGFSQEDLFRMTNPNIVGKSAALNMLKVINSQYDSANAVKTVNQKKATTQATKVEKPGDGSNMEAATPSLSKLKEAARATGDWTAYLEGIGAI